MSLNPLGPRPTAALSLWNPMWKEVIVSNDPWLQLKINNKNQIKVSAHFVFSPVCQPSKHAGSGPDPFWMRPVMAHYGQRPAGIGLDLICRIQIGCFFPALEVARILIIGSKSDPFLCIRPASDIVMRYAGSAWPERGQNRPASSETDPDHVPFCITGRMVIDRSESDPFFYSWPASNIDALCWIRLAWTKPDMTCLRRNRSGPHPAFLFRAGWSLTDPNRIRFSTSGPLLISMRYAGSAWPEQSQIWPAYSETGLDHIRHFYSGPDGHRPIRIGSVYLHLFFSDIDTLCQIRLAWMKPDPTCLRWNRSRPHPAFQVSLFRAGRSSTDPNRIRFRCLASDIDAVTWIRLA